MLEYIVKGGGAMNKLKLYGIQLSDLQLFLYVAKYKSFTKAGEIMFMTQSGVSKRISQIEKELGLILFSRNKREVLLTPAGRVLQERLSGVITDILDAIASAHIVQTGTAGVLRIAYLEWDNIIFIEILKKFMNMNPQFDVEITGHQFLKLHEALAADTVDIIFTTSYDCFQYDEETYNIFFVDQVPLIACISRDNPLSEKESIAVEDLAEEPILMLNYTASPGYSNYVNSIFKKHSIRPVIGPYANTGIEHIGNVLLDKGILFASSYLLQDSQKKDIAQIPVENEFLHIVAISKKDNKSLVLGEFLKYILSTEPKW